MSVNSSSRVTSTLYASASTAPVISTDWKVDLAEEVKVVSLSSAEVETTLTYSTHYTLAGLGNDNGFTVTMVGTIAAGTRITVLPATPATEESRYSYLDSFSASKTQSGYDRATNRDKRILNETDRTFKVPESEIPTFSGDLPGASARAGKNLAFDADGNPTTSNPDVDAAGVVFNTVAALEANTTTYAHNTEARVVGYYSGERNTFGPPVYLDTSDSSTASDRLSCFVDADGNRWKRSFSEAVNVKWAGAKGDGTTDDTDAFRAIFSMFSTNGGGILYIPEGRFRLYADAEGDELNVPSNTTIMGDGEASVLFHDDQDTDGTGGTGVLAWTNFDALDFTDTENIVIKDFRVESTLETYANEDNIKPFFGGRGITNFRMENVSMSQFRGQATNFYEMVDGTFNNCRFNQCLRTAIRCGTSQNIAVTNCTFEAVGDDVINMNAANNLDWVGEGFTITNCTFELCVGIKLLGGKAVTIGDNVFRRSLRRPIYIYQNFDGSVLSTGDQVPFAINITNNICLDTLVSYGDSGKPSIAADEVILVQGYRRLEDTTLNATITATTISATNSGNTFNDSANQFIANGFITGDYVDVSGFTGEVANNSSFIVTDLTAGTMTIGGSDGDVIADDAAGESVTIETRRQPGVNYSTFDYNYLNNMGDDGEINVGLWSVNISNNIIARTLPEVTNYSDYGYRPMLDQFLDPIDDDIIIEDADYDCTGIRVIGPANGVSISHNMLSGGSGENPAIKLDRIDTATTTDFTNTTVESNTIFDWISIGLQVNGTQNSLVKVSNNTFDLDPFFRHSGHNADNTWDASTDLIAISGAGTDPRFIIEGNMFSHLSGAVAGNTGQMFGAGNYLICEPTAVGNNAANKGVRNVVVSDGVSVIWYDGDPASDTFRKVDTFPRTHAASIPTTGKYCVGHIVKNTAATVQGSASSQYIIWGWYRITTGSGHVLNTDWVQMRALTGT